MQLASWEHAINNAAAAIDKHLLSTVFSKYSFVKHCNAIKRYLLLGQGDFIQTLMDLLGPDLGKKAQEMSEYQLNGSLDAAIRASNAQFDDADVLDRLRVKLAKPTAMETGHPTLFLADTIVAGKELLVQNMSMQLVEVFMHMYSCYKCIFFNACIKSVEGCSHQQVCAGWDVFILWYDVREPVSTIITAQAMSGYLRLFRLLWTLKRVEHTLNRVWQVMSGMQRQLTMIRALSSQYGLPCPGLAPLTTHMSSSMKYAITSTSQPPQTIPGALLTDVSTLLL